MKKVLVFALLICVTICCAACNKEVNIDAIKSSTEEVWDKSTQNECVEQISFKNVNVGGVLKINNLVFDVEKKNKDGKFSVNMETRKNMSVSIDENVKSIIDMVLDYKKLQGNLKVKHLEQAFSKVGVKLNFQADQNEIIGYLELLNVKDMFKDNMSKSSKIDFRFAGEENKQLVQVIYNQLKAHPISTFVPGNKQSLNLSKETPVNCDTTQMCNLANAIVGANCNKCYKDSDKTLKHILYDTFADFDGEAILKKVLQIESPTAKYKLSTINQQNYVSEVNFNSNFKVNISKKQLYTAAEDLTFGKDKDKQYEILSNIIGILNYDTALIEGELEVLCQNTVKN